MKVILWMSALVSLTTALNNGLARTPPMGWLSWERFRCNTDCVSDPNNCISEQLFKQMADIMVQEGYKDAGYEYVNIDACWPAPQRDGNGNLVPDPARFPSGMKDLTDYIHSKGLKFGMYEDFGHITCLGFPGSEFHLQQDADTFASWEIDLLKFDGCSSDPRDADIGYPIMEFFLNKTGRPILFSCEWSVYQRKQGFPINYTAVANGCNTWRNYDDIQDSWDSVLDILDYWGNNTGDFLSKAGPGSFSDPDMLIVGDFGLSYDQQRAQMGMWAMLSAPLHMSVDLRNINPASKAILQNRRVIALNQDPKGYQARRILKLSTPGKGTHGVFQVWRKELAQTGSYALAIVNSSDQGVPNVFNSTLADLGLTSSGGYNVTEVFDGTGMGEYKPQSPFVVKVNPSGIVLVTCVPL